MLFSTTAAVTLTYWIAADPSHDSVKAGWGWVLAFSGMLLVVGAGIVAFGQMFPGTWAARCSFLVGASYALGSVVNVVEDGLGQEWAFILFGASVAIPPVALLGMTLALAFGRRGRERLLALVPAGTLVGVLLYVEAGGPLLLVTWLGAAAFVRAARPGRSPVEAAHA